MIWGMSMSMQILKEFQAYLHSGEPIEWKIYGLLCDILVLWHFKNTVKLHKYSLYPTLQYRPLTRVHKMCSRSRKHATELCWTTQVSHMTALSLLRISTQCFAVWLWPPPPRATTNLGENMQVFLCHNSILTSLYRMVPKIWHKGAKKRLKWLFK